MKDSLESLLQEIDRCYQLGGQDLLKRERLEEVESRIIKELDTITLDLDDEILRLKFEKQNGGWRMVPKPGFHGISSAHSHLEIWRILVDEILKEVKIIEKSFKNRLEAEGLFIESRSKEGSDLHLLIGEKDGKSNKAHVIIGEKTGEIRVEDNQIEPLDLVSKIESIITLRTGRRIRSTRESINEIEGE